MGIARTTVMRTLSGLAGAVVLIAVLSGCGGTTAGLGTSRLPLSSCVVQGVHARCGSLRIAENPAAPNGRKISLRVVVLPATTSDRAADPLFYLAGGPGGAASDSVMWAAEHFKALNLNHDLVFVDQRGTGGSNQVTCFTAGVSGTSRKAQVAAVIQACLTALKGKADPRYYTTPIAVDDFDQVRAALGYDKIDLYGGSYGVSSALAYIQRHGAHVRAAVLDSGSLLDVHLLELVPRAAEQTLMSLFARCRSSVTCAPAFPNLQADFTTVTTRLAKSPLATPVVDPSTGGFFSLDLPTFMGLLMATYLDSAPASVPFPKDIHAAAQGDWTGILKTVASYAASTQTFPFMYFTIECSDDWATLDPGRVAAVAPDSPFTPYQVQQATLKSEICKYWPHGTGASGLVKSSAPIVFLNGTADPTDPPANVATAHATMPNSLVVPVPGSGHGQLDFDPLGYLTAEANSFLDLGVPSSPGLWSGAQSIPFPDFVV